MKKFRLSLFITSTYTITWGLGIIYLLFSDEMTAILGEITPHHPLFFLAVYAPTLSSLLIITGIHGPQGLKHFLQRIKPGGISPLWYAGIILLFLALHVFLRCISVALGETAPTPGYTVQMALPMALFYFFADPGPIGEEFGWRGFALPLIQKKMPPISAAVTLGVIWALWHLPSFFISGLGHSTISFLFFSMQVIGLSVFMTSVYNATGGTVSLMIVMHWLSNLGGNMDIHAFSNRDNAISAIVYVAAGIIIHKFITKDKKITDPLSYQ